SRHRRAEGERHDHATHRIRRTSQCLGDCTRRRQLVLLARHPRADCHLGPAGRTTRDRWLATRGALSWGPGAANGRNVRRAAGGHTVLGVGGADDDFLPAGAGAVAAGKWPDMTGHLIHIGYPKTGSNFLRAWFAQHPQLAYADGGIAGFLDAYS